MSGFRVRDDERPLLGASVRWASVCVLAVYFAAAALYNSPANPLKLQFYSYVQSAITRPLHQNWSLFAPDPISSDLILLVRPHGRETEAGGATGPHASRWYDVSTPLWHRFQENRFSAYERLARIHVNSIHNYLYGGASTRSWRNACRNGSERACEVVNSTMERLRERAVQRLVRVASAYLQDIGADPTGVRRMELRIREREAVTWSEREGGEPQSTESKLGVFPVDYSVEPAGIFRPPTSRPPDSPRAAGSPD